MSIVERDTGYYDGLKQKMDADYEKSVDAQLGRNVSGAAEEEAVRLVFRAPLGRAIVKVESNKAVRKVGSVWLVDSTVTDLGRRVLRGVIQNVHPERIEVGGWTGPHPYKAGDMVLIDRKAAKRLIRGAEPGMIVSVWTNYMIAICQ